MIDKKLILAIVVIVIVIIGGFFAIKYMKGGEGAATGQLTEVPEANAGNAAGETAVNTDASKFSEITESMSADDVVALVGEPSEKQTTTTAKGTAITYWYYTDNSNEVWQIGISNNEVQVVRKY